MRIELDEVLNTAGEIGEILFPGANGTPVSASVPVFGRSAPQIAPSAGELINQGIEIVNRVRDFVKGAKGTAQDPGGAARDTVDQLRQASAFASIWPFLLIGGGVLVLVVLLARR